MNGKQHFIDCCNEYGIVCDSLFTVGSGHRCSKDGRFRYRCPHTSRKESNIFVIKYFEEEKLYIAWDLRGHKLKRQSNFSLSKESLNARPYEKCFQITKNREHKGHEEELVTVFTPTGVVDFFDYIFKEEAK